MRDVCGARVERISKLQKEYSPKCEICYIDAVGGGGEEYVGITRLGMYG